MMSSSLFTVLFFSSIMEILNAAVPAVNAVHAVFLNLSTFNCSMKNICFALVSLLSFFLVFNNHNLGKVPFASWCVGKILFYVLLCYNYVGRDG